VLNQILGSSFQHGKLIQAILVAGLLALCTSVVDNDEHPREP